MYVCTLEKIYSGRSACIAVQPENEILNGNYTGSYTITTMGVRNVINT